jgi:hypothetical protein
MTTENTTGYKTFQATAVALAASIRVTLDSDGLISVAGATDNWIGVTQEAIAASGYGTVKLRNAPGSFLVTASAAITRGAKLYPTAAGKVDDAAGTGNFTGLCAAETATASGDVIEAVSANDLAFTASADQTAITDNTGGSVADAIAAVVTAPTALTDNGGGTADATVASQAAPVALTDNTGDSGTHDDTLADGLTTSALGDLVATNAGWGSSTEAGFDSIATKFDLAVADIATANQNISDLGQKLIELVTLATTTQNNFKELTTSQEANRLAIVALTNGLAKNIELTNALRTALVNAGLIKGSA